MKKIAIIQARIGATRFPGKVLEKLGEKPILQWVVEAAKKIAMIDDVIVATTDSELDKPIINWCKNNEITYFQGSELDVLERYYRAAKEFSADVVVRITADCPLLDANIAGQVLYIVSQGLADYASNVLPPTWPDGLDCEAFTFQALETAYLNAVRPSDREHVTPYIRNNQYKFKVVNVPSPIQGLQKHRWTIDTKEDLEFLSKLIAKAKPNATTYDLLSTLQHNPQIEQPKYQRNEGFAKSIKDETIDCINFKNSSMLLQQALKTIPLGAQTFSKSYIQFPENNSPMFLTHGLGSRTWDVDGNEYIDLISALLPNVLGYNDVDVNFAIQSQLMKGISFSLATELESQLAEKLCTLIPCAEMVRFGKNGTDATSAAVRLARAFTGRDKIMTCGYHGWQDWYIGTTSRNKGVPKSVCALSTAIPYNDLNRVEELIKTEEYAAIIMEPCNTTPPESGYLQKIKDLCEKFNSLLIFDEVITGFRFALGGAQEYFGVTPHLACFGKAMGNGMPISAIVGRKDIMHEMEEIFFSGTFGGEALSLAASLATIDKMEKFNVIQKQWTYGENLAVEVGKLINEYNLQKVFNLCGYAPWKIIQYLDTNQATAFEIKTFFIQEMIKRGILISASFNINYSHTEIDMLKILQALNETFALLSEYLDRGCLVDYLRSPAIKPLFKVR